MIHSAILKLSSSLIPSAFVFNYPRVERAELCFCEVAGRVTYSTLFFKYKRAIEVVFFQIRDSISSTDCKTALKNNTQCPI